MDFKELIRDLTEDFFVIFTCSILGYIIFMFLYDIEFVPLTDLFVIFILSIAMSLIGLVVYFGHSKLTRSKLIIRYIIHFFIGLALLLSAATYVGWILWSMPITVIRMVILFCGVSISVHTTLFIQTKLLSDKLNAKLKERYKD